MYTNRRPVPSKAALQILRQLAYISSGTVCGAVALVAEERRRQTCIAKKIVENSKRIKQHPRYAHGAAAVALQEADHTLYDNDFQGREQEERIRSGHGEHDSTQDGRARRGGVGRSRAPDLQLAPRNSVLPSEVDKGYRRTVLREDPRSIHRSHHNHENSSLESESRPRLRKNKNEPGNGSTTSGAARTETRTGSNLPTASQSVLEAKSRRDKIHTSLANDIGQRWYDQAVRRLDLVKTTGALNSPTAPFASHVLDPKPSVNSPPHPRTVRNAVQIFLDLHPPPNLRRPVPKTMVAFVADLLNRATEQGESQAIFALLRWLDAHNDLREEHVRCVTDRTDILLRNLEFDTLTHGELLDSFRLSSLSDRDGGRLKILAAIFCDLAKARALDRTHVKLLQDFSKSCGYTDIVQPLSAVCSQLAHDESFRNAVGLFKLSASLATSSHDLVPLARTLLELGVQTADFQGSKFLLAFLDKSGESLSNPIEELLASANAVERLADAVDVCQEFLPRHALSASSYRLFLLGLSRTDRVNLIPLFLSQLPLPLDSDVLSASQRQWGNILRRQMKETGNFSLVSKTFDSMRQLAGTGKLSITVYNTMIRLCMQYRQDDRAQQVLRRLRDEDKLSPDVSTFMFWLLGYAKDENWEEVDRYLNVLKEDAFDTIDPSKRAHILHPLIAAYAKHHDSAEVWSFVTRLFSVHGATMHRATFSIVFKALIRGENPERIVDWLAFVREQGLEIDLNASDAIDAFREYYYAWQPLSQTFSHLVRRMSYECPQLLSKELLLLNINAVGQDIRHEVGYGRQADVRQAHTEEADALHGRLAFMGPAEGDARDVALAREPSTLPDSLDSTHIDAELAATSDADLTGDKAEMMAVDSGYGSDTSFSSPGSPVLEPTVIEQSPATSSQSMLKDRKNDRHYERQLLKSKMLSEMTIGRPEEALKLYRESLSATGLPISSVSLDIAIEAGLAVEQGGRELADEIIEHAQSADMDTTSTLTPLMVHHFKNLSKDGRDTIPNVDKLVADILHLYRTMSDKNVPVTHHVAVTAARTMIRFGHPKRAVHLLRQIFFASQTYRASFDIVTYSVFLKAYVACGNEKGAAWVIQHILKTNIHIDRKFLLGLKENAALLRSRRNPVKEESKRQSIIGALRQWIGECRERRHAQIRETNSLGNRMVDALVACSEPRPEEQRPLRIRQAHVYPKRSAKRPIRLEMLASKRVRRLRRSRPRRTPKVARKVQEIGDAGFQGKFSRAVSVDKDFTASSPSWI